MGRGTIETVSRDGLSKREISWLLAQEARGAAQALRQGLEIQVREGQLPADSQPASTGLVNSPMLDGLSALDDAMSLLGELQSHKGVRRRGRIDVAAILYELSPEATITMATKEGTEIVGDEEHVRRMLQLLLTQSGGQTTSHTVGPALSIHREGDFVHISAELGPDASHHSSLERRWLNRMALRAGGRQIITGGQQTLVLPADGALQEKEMEALRQELTQAQELGEAYARELANVLTVAEKEAASHHGSEDADATWQGALLVARALGVSRRRSLHDEEALEQTLAPLSYTTLNLPLNKQPQVSYHDLFSFVGAAQSQLLSKKELKLQVERPDSSQIDDRRFPQASAESLLTWLVVESYERAPQGSIISVELDATPQQLAVTTRFPRPTEVQAEGVPAALLRTYLTAMGGQFSTFEKGDDIACLSGTLPVP